MKTVQQRATLWPIPEPTNHGEVLKFIERIGRACYKSEDKITDESAVKFIQMLRDRQHWAMLEHYIFVISVPQWIYEDITDPEKLNDPENWDLREKINFIRFTHWKDAPQSDWEYIVSGSATAFNYLWATDYYRHLDNASGLVNICAFLQNSYPELMVDPCGGNQMQYDEQLHFVEKIDVEKWPPYLRKTHDWMSYKITCDRGVSHELVRHRPASYAQESTRYCNYSKGKYGNEITLVRPTFFEQGSMKSVAWEVACGRAEESYLQLTGYGCSPNEARSILPHSTKVDITMTARMGEFLHFFKMRADAAAHPQMREIAVPMLQQAFSYASPVFSDLYERMSEGGENAEYVKKEKDLIMEQQEFIWAIHSSGIPKEPMQDPNGVTSYTFQGNIVIRHDSTNKNRMTISFLDEEYPIQSNEVLRRILIMIRLTTNNEELIQNLRTMLQNK